MGAAAPAPAGAGVVGAAAPAPAGAGVVGAAAPEHCGLIAADADAVLPPEGGGSCTVAFLFLWSSSMPSVVKQAGIGRGFDQAVIGRGFGMAVRVDGPWSDCWEMHRGHVFV